MQNNAEEQNKTDHSRRNFIRNSATALAGLYIVPRHVLGKGFIAPSDKLTIAGIGVGGKGFDDIDHCTALVLFQQKDGVLAGRLLFYSSVGEHFPGSIWVCSAGQNPREGFARSSHENLSADHLSFAGHFLALFYRQLPVAGMEAKE